MQRRPIATLLAASSKSEPVESRPPFWAELAAQTRVPVFLVFCNHLPGGRYALTIDPPWTLGRGEEPSAVLHLGGEDASRLAHVEL